MINTIGITLLILSSLINLALAIKVYAKNPRASANRLFSLLALSVIGWSTANYLGIHIVNTSQYFFLIKIAFTFLTLQNLFFLLFIGTFPSQRLTLNKLFAIIYIAGSLSVAALPYSGSFFATYTDGLNPAMGAMIFMLWLLFSVVAGFILLISRLRHMNGPARNQSRFLLTSAVILWVLIPLHDVVLNTLLPYFFLFRLISPLLALLFSLTLAYAVIRRRLFDIRPIAARTFAYVLFLGVLVVVYVIAAFGVTTLLKLK